MTPAPLFLPFRFSLLLAALSCVPVHAQQGAKSDDTGFVGLPVTGQLDAGRVLSSRHGDPEKAAADKDKDKDQDKDSKDKDSKEAPKPPRPVRGATIPAGGITGVVIESSAREDQSEVPLTFGQVFAPGDLPRGAGLAGKLADGSLLPLQLDVKASHPDGSVRHAVISLVLPRLGAGKDLGLALVRSTKKAPAGPAAKAGGASDTVVSVVVDG